MRIIFLPVLALLLGALPLAAADPAGIRPVGADGKPLNLDFETGDLRDWTATGEAFKGQPIQGDTIAKRRKDMKSEHQGAYWIGTFERGGDAVQGILTSVSFKITQPWASFLIAAGKTPASKAEIFVKDNGSERAVFRASGTEIENLRRVVVNLTPYLGKEMFVRITDQGSSGWDHVNFDDFLFHATEPKFATLQKTPPPLPVDDVKFAGLSPDKAAREMTLPRGFKATLFAGEPDVVQPIAFCMDDRGRLWVVEGMTYPKRAAEGEGKDRILVFEDTDGDGKFNKRSVFMDKLNLVSGIEVGFGGVWIGAAPNLMFVPVKDWDDPKPAGEPKILLDGWDFKADTHETLNTFTWGPDGWLYGCHGVFCPSLVGKPGSAEKDRQWVDAAVWRYHPTKDRFEIFSEGTSNPWGIDFDSHGQCFIEACVVPHFWHIIQGARYLRQGGEHYCITLEETARNERYRNEKSRKPIFPFYYADIPAHGDHVHYAGTKGPHAGNGKSDAAGGGHAHAGLLVYQGNSWPAAYRGKIFMNNIHGQRINMDVPVRVGSGFVGKHGADFINFNDRWSQIINLLAGPDGSVFMIDWYDKNQCHLNNLDAHDRSNGRIFKISYGNPKAPAVDLAKLSDNDLVKLLVHPNQWQARHAMRLLQERHSAALLNPTAEKEGLAVNEALLKILKDDHDSAHQVRALQALHLTDGLIADTNTSTKRAAGLEQLKSKDEYIRSWTIQLLCEDRQPGAAAMDEFARMAQTDKSPVVRLYLASACQRLSVDQRLPILEALLGHAEDAKDHNLPLMYWYATEAVAAQGPAKAVALLGKAKIPQIRELITKRMTANTAK